jgi:hypothetical protein
VDEVFTSSTICPRPIARAAIANQEEPLIEKIEEAIRCEPGLTEAA